MKAILFALVLAVTLPADFFSPTPLDKLTMNLNIADSPRERQRGYPGDDPAWAPWSRWGEEDAVTDQTPGRSPAPPRTSLSEKEMLDKMMKGVEELKEREKSGNLSPEAIIGGDQCDGLQIAICAATLPFKVAKCAVEFELKGPLAILNCVTEIVKSECRPCICYFFELANLPCPDPEFGEKAFTDERGYIACYANTDTPLLYDKYKAEFEQTNSKRTCITYCKNQHVQANYIGLENGGLCRCGLEPPPAAQTIHRNVSDSICEEVQCPGAGETSCGNKGYVKVYKIVL